MMIRQGGKLLFDSAFAEPAPQWRSGFCVERTLLFRSGEYSVDLIAHGGSDSLQLLHGQVVREDTGSPVAGAHVSLATGSDPVRTDEHGQFAVSTLHSDAQQVLMIETGEVEVMLTIPAPGDGPEE